MVRTGNLFPARLRTTHIEKHQNMTYRRNGKLQASPLTKLAAKTSRDAEGRPSHQGLSTTVDNSGSAAYVAHLESTSRPNTFQSFSSSVSPTKSPLTSTPTPFLVPSSLYPENPVVTKPKELPVGRMLLSGLQGFENGSFISHSAVLAENEPKLGLSPPALSESSVSQNLIDRGVGVLMRLKDLSSIQRYIDKWFSFAGGVVVIEPMVKIYLEGIWLTWGKILESSKITDLQAMSAQIWENTSRPLSDLLKRDTTPREFCAGVTGAGLRWEVVGIITSVVPLIAQSLKDGDPIFCSHDAAPVDKDALAANMHAASEMCVQFCDELDILNDLYLWLLYGNSVAYCSLRSRGRYDNWKKQSALAAALQCANLHQEIKVDDNTPFFIAELRKRVFICAYSNDKIDAVFAGRPPKLTRLYCRLQIPLDLTDAQTMSEGPELEAAVAELDEDGWNQYGTVQRSTFARIAARNALITEEILEISMGCFAPDEVIRRAADINTRALKAWDDLPEFLRIDVNDLWNSPRSPIEVLYLVVIRLANLDHRFLLQRILSKKAQLESPPPNLSLLLVCGEIFKVVVMMIDNKDYFRDFQIDFVQILCQNGIPAAAVLAVELLNQERDPTSASAQAFPLHRSDTIQSLSVFVSCLGTIKPGAHGYQSCNRGKAFLKKILDLILGPGPAAPRNILTEVDTGADPTLGASLFELGDDGDFMRWLDVQWDQESWINFT
ncbi:hypothetical protein E8E13_007122 [Curvularia kusanoi]|uniref:Xylanolytic transcriptional activator regulatory domain-containing protein n=1 Tax=Curvularia kusanoi TaxID=90978 RepID=A0A9P4WEW9_CURKU|nr:hypothetical protein E8E13_007122 [Curvularia kusanoi]